MKQVEEDHFMLVSCLVYSLTLKVEAECSTRTLVGFHHTTQHYIPGDRILQIIIITPASIRPTETCCRYYKTNSFCHFRSFLKLFSFFWYYKIFLGVPSEHFLCYVQFLSFCKLCCLWNLLIPHHSFV